MNAPWIIINEPDRCEEQHETGYDCQNGYNQEVSQGPAVLIENG